jgi:hypothetical protein
MAISEGWSTEPVPYVVPDVVEIAPKKPSGRK